MSRAEKAISCRRKGGSQGCGEDSAWPCTAWSRGPNTRSSGAASASAASTEPSCTWIGRWNTWSQAASCSQGVAGDHGQGKGDLRHSGCAPATLQPAAPVITGTGPAWVILVTHPAAVRQIGFVVGSPIEVTLENPPGVLAAKAIFMVQAIFPLGRSRSTAGGLLLRGLQRGSRFSSFRNLPRPGERRPAAWASPCVLRDLLRRPCDSRPASATRGLLPSPRSASDQ